MIEHGLGIGTVGIGGINLSNAQRVLYQSHAGKKGLDGVAIVSAIMAADDPEAAASQFKKRIEAQAPFATIPRAPREAEGAALLGEVPGIVREVVNAHPLTHNMINYVVANFVANVILSMYVFAHQVCFSVCFFFFFIHTMLTISGEPLPLCPPTEMKRWILPSMTAPWLSTWALSPARAFQTTLKP